MNGRIYCNLRRMELECIIQKTKDSKDAFPIHTRKIKKASHIIII